MDISIFGLGYVGCVSVGCLAKLGHKVIAVDISPDKIKYINEGKATIVEKGAEKLILKGKENGLISATNDSKDAVQKTIITIVCVGTPSTDNGHLNLNAVYKVAEEIGYALRIKKIFHTILIRSTVLPGTNEKVTEIIEKISGKINRKDFAVVSNPEFLREGSAINDFFNPTYTIIGTENNKAINICQKLYKDIEAPMYIIKKREAELLKYVNNSFHALKVTFANEIGSICKSIGINSHKLMDIFCKDRNLNISPNYFKPGFAYGGSCLPKDLKALKTIAHDNYLECPVLENISVSNQVNIQRVLKDIISFKIKNIGVIGISFKKGTDDLRNSPIIDIIEILIGKGYNIKIYDPNVHISKLFGANKSFIQKKLPIIEKLIIDDRAEFINHSKLMVIVHNEKNYRNIIENSNLDSKIYDLININYTNRKNYYGLYW